MPGRSRGRSRVALTALLVAATGLAGAGVATAAPAAPALNTEYVALGDSFAAGPLIFPQVTGAPCFRSAVNYAHLVAKAIGARTFRDVTCSSATTANVLTTPQSGVPVQLGAVTPTTTLVTLTIGANDAKLVDLVSGCIQLLPLGPSCKEKYTVDGVDRGTAAIDAVAPAIARTIDAIHAKAPLARIVLTSYGNYIRPGGCYPLQPIRPVDATYVQGLINRLGQVTSTVAAAHGAEYVDFIGPGTGHDGCNLLSNWITFVVPGITLGLVPLHPTALGERNFARILTGHLIG
jgi:lysophospholipase L1-like esterase